MEEKDINKERLEKVGALLRRVVLIFCLAIIFHADFAYAGEQRTVKVAFFPMNGYHIWGPNGSHGGMDVDYLTELSKYTGWKMEYVECDSWDDALVKLQAHEVDLVGSAQYSEQRAQIYDYADLSSGYTYGVIATNSDGTIAYEDFDAMEDITFGMVKTYVRRKEFLSYLAVHGIEQPKIKEYESTQLLYKALNEGEVDAMVHTFMEIKEEQCLIGRFAPKPIYYITWKGNETLLQELNSAIADQKFNYPELESDLINKYYESRIGKSVLLTSEEQEYLRQKKTLTAGYLDGNYPFSYSDSETGEFAGLSRKALEDALLWTGISLEYRQYRNHEEAQEALKNGEIDLQAYSIQSIEGMDNEYAKELTAYVHLPLVIVSDSMRSFDKIDKLATVAAFSDFVEQSGDNGDAQIVIMDHQLECLQMLADGKVDAVLCDGYLAESQIRTSLQYHTLKISMVLNMEHSAGMVVRCAVGSELASILSKTVSTISVRDINEYALQENSYPLLNVSTFIRNNSLSIIFIIICISIVVILVAARMVHDSRKIQKLMYKESDIDIWNMNYLYYMGKKLVQSEKRERYAILSLNVSKLRDYSIIYGWKAGVHLVEEIGKDAIRICIDDKKEICARNYGGRFVLLLHWTDWKLFAERLENMKQFIEEYIYGKTENRMPVSMGIYELPVQDNNIHNAVHCANQALEMAMKGDAEGKTIAVYDKTFERKVTERHQTETLLETVDIAENFVAYYQHKVDIRTGMIVGAEALVRFLDPTANGAVRSPAFFVPYYEKTGRIVDVDFCVMEAACKMLRKRLDEGKRVVPVSCNFSRMHFAKPGFVERFEKVLDKYHVSKELVEVEITETLVMEKLQENIIRETLRTLKEKEIRLSIDDFGSGYSSLGSFVHVPASTIKLDRSFLLNKENPDRQLKIMRGIVRMSEELEAEIVCEGVENEDDLKLMQQIGAHIAQGYFFSKPEPQKDFEAHLDA